MSTLQWKLSHKKEMVAYYKKWYRKNKAEHRFNIKKRKKEIRLWLDNEKTKFKCEKCNASHIAFLQFHHLDPSKKDDSIANAIYRRGWSIEKIKNEISKCQILCANCHFILHWEEKQNLMHP